MSDVLIPPRDQERIDALVAQYRHDMETAWRLAYLQGRMDSTERTIGLIAQPRKAA